jgi:hypothetical protein
VPTERAGVRRSPHVGLITVSAPARLSFETFSRSVAAATIRILGSSSRAVGIEKTSLASLLVAASTARALDARPPKGSSSEGVPIRTTRPVSRSSAAVVSGVMPSSRTTRPESPGAARDRRAGAESQRAHPRSSPSAGSREGRPRR